MPHADDDAFMTKWQKAANAFATTGEWPLEILDDGADEDSGG